MSFEDWQKVWQEEPAQQPDDSAKVDLAAVRRQARAFDRMIMWRDAREIVAALIVAVVFGWTGLSASKEGVSPLLPWIATVIPLGVAGFLMIDRRRMRRKRSKGGETVLTEIDHALGEIRHQTWLLRNVLWWYILPLGAAALLFMLFVVLQAPLPVLVRALTVAIMLAVIAATNVWVWRINRLAVQRHLEPQIEELEKQRATFAAAAEEPADED